jgi:NDMA-dependent alcohol dehydrogenase
MKTRAALLREQPGVWTVDEVDLDEPSDGEVLVEMIAAGLCHSDDHIAHGSSKVGTLPFCGGHEGSGIVRAVGPSVRDLAEGDHIVTSFIPACGRCRWCASGMQQLCDYGRLILAGSQLDGTYRMRAHGKAIGCAATLGTFSQWQVFDESSCIKIAKDLPLDVAALVSCGVPTGWGSATNVAGIEVGDVVIVVGSGGIGMNAVQGAAHKGAAHVVVVDPVPYKRERAPEFGATETFADIGAATEFVRDITNGQGADSAIVTVGVVTGEHVAAAFNAIRKAGTVVVTGVGHSSGIPVNLFELTMFQKRIQGCIYGNGSPSKQVPRLLELYRAGTLKLDELITRRYRLDEINDGYADMHAGVNIRGVIDFRVP